jgi:hypothetical protein
MSQAVPGANAWHATPQSSNVQAFYYDDENRVLHMKLGPKGKPPRTYRYRGVPPEVFAGLLAAPSKGKYHHANIKWSFPY